MNAPQEAKKLDAAAPAAGGVAGFAGAGLSTAI